MFCPSRFFCIRAVRAFMSTEIVKNSNTNTNKQEKSLHTFPGSGLTQAATTTTTTTDTGVATAQRLTSALLAQQQRRRMEKKKEEAQQKRTAHAPPAQAARATLLHDMPSDRSLVEIQAGFTESYGRTALITMDCHVHEGGVADIQAAHAAEGKEGERDEKRKDDEADDDDNKSGSSDTFIKNINATWNEFPAAEKMGFVCMSPQGRRSARALEALMAERSATPRRQASHRHQDERDVATRGKQRGRRGRTQGRAAAAAAVAPGEAVGRSDRLSRLLRHYAAAGARQRKVKSPPGIHQQPSTGSPHMEAVLGKHNRTAATAQTQRDAAAPPVLTPARHAFNETKRKNQLRKRAAIAKRWEEQWSSLLPASAAGMFQQIKKGHSADAPLDLQQSVSFKSQSPPISEDFVELCNEFRVSSPRKAYVMRRLFGGSKDEGNGATTPSTRPADGAAAGQAAAASRLAEWRARAQKYSDEYDAHLARLRRADADAAQAATSSSTSNTNGEAHQTNHKKSVFYPHGKGAVDSFKEMLMEEEVAKLKEDIRTFADNWPFLDREIAKNYGHKEL